MSCQVSHEIITRAHHHRMQPCGLPTFTVCSSCSKEVCFSCMKNCRGFSFCAPCHRQHRASKHGPQFSKPNHPISKETKTKRPNDLRPINLE